MSSINILNVYMIAGFDYFIVTLRSFAAPKLLIHLFSLQSSSLSWDPHPFRSNANVGQVDVDTLTTHAKEQDKSGMLTQYGTRSGSPPCPCLCLRPFLVSALTTGPQCVPLFPAAFLARDLLR